MHDILGCQSRVTLTALLWDVSELVGCLDVCSTRLTLLVKLHHRVESFSLPTQTSSTKGRLLSDMISISAKYLAFVFFTNLKIRE